MLRVEKTLRGRLPSMGPVDSRLRSTPTSPSTVTARGPDPLKISSLQNSKTPRLHERREQGRPVRVGRPQTTIEGRPPLVPVLAFGSEIRHRRVRERRPSRLLLVEGVQTLRRTRLRRTCKGLAMEHVLPPPVLGALVAAPPQVHFITFTIGGVLLAVLAGAEPGPAWKSTRESGYLRVDGV